MRCFPTGLTFHRYRFAAAIISQPYTRKRNKYGVFRTYAARPNSRINEYTGTGGRDKSRPYSHAGGVTRRLSMSKPQPRPCPQDKGACPLVLFASSGTRGRDKSRPYMCGKTQGTSCKCYRRTKLMGKEMVIQQNWPTAPSRAGPLHSI